MIYSETTTPFSEEDESTNRNILDSPTTTTTIIRVVGSDGDYMKVTTMTNIGETARKMFQMISILIIVRVAGNLKTFIYLF